MMMSLGDDFLGIYSGAPTRAHTLTRMHQGRGRRGGTFGAGPLFQPLLLSQVSGPSLNSSGGFHNLTVLSENPWARERKLTDVSPQGKFGRPHHSPAHAPSIITLSAAYIGVSLHLRCLWNLENDRWSHTKAPDAMIGGTAQTFPKVSGLANNFSLQGVEHFLKEWVCWPIHQGEEERLTLPCNYPLLIICLPKISDDQSYNQIFVKMI